MINCDINCDINHIIKATPLTDLYETIADTSVTVASSKKEALVDRHPNPSPGTIKEGKGRKSNKGNCN